MDVLLNVISFIVFILFITLSVVKIRKIFYEGAFLKINTKVKQIELLSKHGPEDNSDDGAFKNKLNKYNNFIFIIFMLNFIYFVFQLVSIDSNTPLMNDKFLSFALNILTLFITACLLIYIDLIKRFFKLYKIILNVQFVSLSNDRYIFELLEKNEVSAKD